MVGVPGQGVGQGVGGSGSGVSSARKVERHACENLFRVKRV